MTKTNENKNPWTTLTNKTVYENPWIKVEHRDVLTPAGTDGIYGVIHFKNRAVGVIPLDKDMNTWLVGQYRYTLSEYSWEIPEGGAPLNESTLDGAIRELKEETGISAQKWTKVLDFATSNSVTDEKGVCYVAQNLTFGEMELEETEDITVRKLPFSEAVEMVMTGKITDALAIMGILATKLRLERGDLVIGD
ncbi:MAG: NUDIX domain-containing protein [Saprospiraceae bacterium]